MEASTKQSIFEIIQANLGEDILSIETPYQFTTVTIKRDRIVKFLRFLYTHEGLQFQFLTDLCAVHYPDAPEPLAVVYHLHSLVYNQRLRIKVFLPADQPELPSVTELFAAANWMERETYDFFGVIFKGHPDLRRILNVDDMVIFPLRKEYPLEDQTREDKEDSRFGR